MTEDISLEIEMLARMWMACDPNRGGTDQDEIIRMFNPERDVPHWHWFVPRAEASLAHIIGSGFTLETKSLIPA